MSPRTNIILPHLSTHAFCATTFTSTMTLPLPTIPHSCHYRAFLTPKRPPQNYFSYNTNSSITPHLPQLHYYHKTRPFNFTSFGCFRAKTSLSSFSHFKLIFILPIRMIYFAFFFLSLLVWKGIQVSSKCLYLRTSRSDFHQRRNKRSSDK